MRKRSPMVTWLYDLQHFGMKLGLDNIRALLRILSHPESAYPCLLIAGTNGKGSVAATVEALLLAAGVKTGMFTSPHLVHPRERIRVAGRDLEADELDRQLARMRERIETALGRGEMSTQPSFFEVITATALQTFKEQGVGAAVLEVGLGGRLDATNAVEADTSVIVGVDLDHTKTLGGTLAEIAGEKAGIIKRGKPVVCGVVQPEALAVIDRIAREREATRIDARARIRLAAEQDGTVDLESAARRYTGLRPSLAGRHQVDNTRIALAAFEVFAERQGLTPDPRAVREAIGNVRWRGRLQWIDERDGMPRMLLDAAHNPAGMQALVAYLRTLSLPRPVALFGVTSGKPLEALLGPLSEQVEQVVLTRPPVERGIDPSELIDAARALVPQVEAVADPAEALERARRLAGTDRYLLVTGSLYLVGEILGLLSEQSVPGPVSM